MDDKKIQQASIQQERANSRYKTKNIPLGRPMTAKINFPPQYQA